MTRAHPFFSRSRLFSLAMGIGMAVGLSVLMLFLLHGGAGLHIASATPLGSGAIGDYVWYDKNVDGEFGSPGDPEYEYGGYGIDGVTVTVYVSDPVQGWQFFTRTVTGDNPGTPDTEHGWYNAQVDGDKLYRVEIGSENFQPGAPLEGLRQTNSSNVENPTIVDFRGQLAPTDFTIDFGYVRPGIELVKLANDAADGDVDYIYAGNTVTYTYLFTNTGDTRLTNLVITDDMGTPGNTGDDHQVCTVAGPLNVGASSSCTMVVNSVSQDVTNTAIVQGDPIDAYNDPLPGGPVTDTDDAKVDVVNPGVTIAKTPDVQYLLSGETADFTITITNTGDTYLSPVTLSDPLATACQTYNGPNPLAPGAHYTYNCSRTNVTADFTNIITVTGTPSDNQGSPLPGINTVQDDDDAQVDVVNPGVTIAKTPDLQYLLSGQTADFTITITNTGDTYLSPVTLSDPLATACQTYNGPDPLAPGAHYTYNCSRTNVTADFTNIITVTGTPSDNQGSPLPGVNTVQDDDDAQVDVVHPAIQITKDPDIQYLLSGQTANFTITITNTGDVRLYPVDTSDPLATNCEKTNILLDAGAHTTFTCFTPNVTADFTNVITATGTPVDQSNQPLGVGDVQDDDDANVDVMAPSIQLSKSLNTPEPVRVGDMVSFTIRITNTGDGWVDILPLTDTYDKNYLQYDHASPASDDNNDDGVINWSDILPGNNMLAHNQSTSVIVYFIGKDDTSNLPPDGRTENRASTNGPRVDPDGPTGPTGATLPVDDDEDTARVKLIIPTGVTVVDAQAAVMGADVSLQWATLSEANILGFNLWRRHGSGRAVRVNTALLPARHAGQMASGSYRFLDHPLLPGYYDYTLEILRLDGTTVRVPLGDVFVRVRDLRSR